MDLAMELTFSTNLAAAVNRSASAGISQMLGGSGITITYAGRWGAEEGQRNVLFYFLFHREFHLLEIST